jgi:mannosyltransferase
VALRDRHLQALAALTLLAAGLRFATLGVQSFDYDEAYTVSLALPGSLGHLLSQLPKTESSPPLHYVLAWAWTQPFGLGEAGVRSLSALAGTAVVPVAYAAARRLASPRAGLIAAALVAVNPFLVWFSQEARPYALLTLLGALSFWAFTAALDDPTPRRLGLWAAASALALWTHYFAAFLVAAEVLWLLWRSTERRRVALACAAVLPLALDQADGRTDWITSQPLGARVAGVASKFLLGEVDPVSDAVLVVVALAAAALAGWGALRAERSERAAVMLAAGVAAVAIAVPLALEAVGVHYLVAKNVIAALPVLAVAAGIALAVRRSGAAGIAGALGLCAFSLAIVVAGALDPRLQRPDYGAAARGLSPVAPGQVVVTPFHGSVPLEHYLPGAAVAPATTGSLTLVQPLRRRDAGGPARDPTPPAPAGFVLAGRVARDTYTLVRYRSRAPVALTPAMAFSLAPGRPGREPFILTWPNGSRVR